MEDPVADLVPSTRYRSDTGTMGRAEDEQLPQRLQRGLDVRADDRHHTA